jgi:immune inhibitor A
MRRLIWLSSVVVILFGVSVGLALAEDAPAPPCRSEPSFEPGQGAGMGPQLMPPHPNALARIFAEGYDSVTIVRLGQRLAALKQAKGIDVPEPVQAPVTGTRPALVLLVEYLDLTHNAGSTATLYNSLLFSEGTYPAPGSMRDYYQEVSYGNFDIAPSLVDSDWRQVSNNHDYYADADGIPESGDEYGFGTYPHNAQGLVVDAVTLANPFVNFASYAVGGEVPGLFVIHAGRGAETDVSHTDWIWSHKWGLYGNAVTVDGVVVNIYSMEPEYTSSPGDSTVGVFCHEYAHVLGVPDLYDTDYSSEGLGMWSLVAHGGGNGNGSSPAHLDAWSKMMLGWVDPVVPTSYVPGASIPAVESNAVVYQLWTSGLIGTEYFLLENRQQIGFDAALPGDGLLLYHVDELASQQDDWHPKVMVEQADGLWDLQEAYNKGDDGDPYPGTSDKRAAGRDTTPDTRSYAGVDTGTAISSISDSATTMSADLMVSGVVVPQAVLEVHPNERAQGPGGGTKLGTAPWQPSGLGPGGWYEWKRYEFDGSGNLWIQVCAQCFNSNQNAVGDSDKLMMKIDGQTPNDAWGIMSGVPGVYQWNGNTDSGNRLTLEFLATGLTPGQHTLQFSADETPIIWWVKVYDLERTAD